jgi:ABC-type hemin transport system ATPase subunit
MKDVEIRQTELTDVVVALRINTTLHHPFTVKDIFYLGFRRQRRESDEGQT